MKLTLAKRMGVLILIAVAGLAALDALQWLQVERVYSAANE